MLNPNVDQCWIPMLTPNVEKSTSMAIFQHRWRIPMSTQCRLALSIADVDFRRWIIDVEKSPSMSILISLSIANDDFEKSPPMLNVWSGVNLKVLPILVWILAIFLLYIKYRENQWFSYTYDGSNKLKTVEDSL